MEELKWTYYASPHLNQSHCGDACSQIELTQNFKSVYVQWVKFRLQTTLNIHFQTVFFFFFFKNTVLLLRFECDRSNEMQYLVYEILHRNFTHLSFKPCDCEGQPIRIFWIKAGVSNMQPEAQNGPGKDSHPAQWTALEHLKVPIKVSMIWMNKLCFFCNFTYLFMLTDFIHLLQNVFIV